MYSVLYTDFYTPGVLGPIHRGRPLADAHARSARARLAPDTCIRRA